MRHALSLLLGASIDGAIAVGVVALASVLLARRFPAHRCRLWWVASCKMLIGLAGIAPLTVPVLPATISTAAAVARPLASAPAVLPAGPVAATGPSWPAILVGAWAAGVLLMGAAVLRRYVLTRRLRASAEPCPDPATAALLLRLGRAVGLTSLPQLRLSPDVSTPQLAGILAPTILLPASRVRALSEDELAMALCHELVHVRRRDLLWGWVPAMAERLFFFHPGAVMAAREYALAREEACDAEVLRVLGVSPARYGRFLVDWNAPQRRSLAPAVGVSTSFLHLRRRLRMLDNAADRDRPIVARWATLALLAIAILVPVRLSARAPQHDGPAAPVSSEDAYVLFLDENSVTMSGSMDDLAAARRLRDERGGQLLWFRESGKEYVVTDPSLLRSVAVARVVDSERAAQARQELMNREQVALEARLEALSHRRDDLTEREIRQQMVEAERSVAAASRQRAQAEMDREIAGASSRIDTLSSERDRIAREIERVAMESDRRIRELLEESIRSGAAHPAGVKGGVKGGVEGGVQGEVDGGVDGGVEGGVEL